MSKIQIDWIDAMGFETEMDGHKITIDAGEQVGGLGRGPKPKPFMLLALGGCAAMDVRSILKKMRVEFEDFRIGVSGELTDEHPKHYTSMHLTFEFWGKDLTKNLKKIEKAVNLSDERYCGVSAVYKKAMEITSEIILHENVDVS